MDWSEEAQAILALTRAVETALRRGDPRAADGLMAEREERVRRFAAAIDPSRPPAGLEGALAEIRAGEQKLRLGLERSRSSLADALARMPRREPAARGPAASASGLDRLACRSTRACRDRAGVRRPPAGPGVGSADSANPAGSGASTGPAASGPAAAAPSS